MSNIQRFLLSIALSLAGTSLVMAEALLKPLPQPDTSKMPPAVGKRLLETRLAFEKDKINLVGPPLAGAYAQMGAAYARAGLIDIAVVAFYDAAQLSPNEGRWIYLQGVLAESKKQTAEARAYYEQAYKLDQDYFPIRFRVAQAKIQQGDLDAARNLMTDYVNKHQNLAAPYSLLAEIALSQKRYADAIDSLKKAQALEPDANKLNALLADAYTGLGDKTAAQQARANAGNRPIHMGDPLVAGITGGGDPDADLVRAKIIDTKVANDPVNQAMMFYNSHQYDSARAALDEALKTRSNDSSILSLYARIDAESGNLPKAKQRLQPVLKSDPNNPLVLLTQGVIAEIGGDESAAADAYSKAIAADTNLAEAHHLLGNILMRRGQYAQAAEQYRPVGKSAVPGADAYARLAAAEILAGHCADAVKDVSAARLAFPKDGILAEVFVRVVSTCPAVRQSNLVQAVEVAQRLYSQSATAANSEAVGLAMAAQGNFDEATKYQTQAIFEATRDQNKTEVVLLNEFLRDFRAKKVPERAWPSDHPYFKPPRLAAMQNLG